MKPKVELKLLSLIYQFEGKVLEKAKFKDKQVGGKKHLVLELGFYDEGGDQSTMVLVLDKNITLNDCEELYEEVIR